MRTVPYILIAMILLAGCKSSGESDLERQLASPSTPGACKSAARVTTQNDAVDFYRSNVYPVMEGDCLDCHTSGGDAGDTAFVLSGAVDDDYPLVAELTEREVAGYPYLLAKASAFAGHTGGMRFPLFSDEARILTNFAALLKGKPTDPDAGGDCSGIPGGELPILEDVSLLSVEETLNKAAMIMLGRRATAAEADAASRGELRTTLRGMMQGPEFTRFVMTAANDQLLTNRFMPGSPLISIDSDYNYYRFSSIDWPGIMPTPDYSLANVYNESLAQEPLALVAYIVTNERDYREVLTADYTVFNSLTHEFFDHQREGHVQLINPDSGESVPPPASPDDWVAGRFAPGVGTGFYVRSGSLHPERIPYPHAGVLTTLPWLARWGNTNTNGQRKRAKMVLRQFLGYDIELTASRPMDAEALNDPDNPTFKKKACTSCHYQLDAMAGTFQNMGYSGRFRLNDLHFNPFIDYLRRDALNEGYRGDTSQCDKPLGEGGYCEGDLWYADRFPAGFVFQGDTAITEMPNDGPGREGPHDNAALKWLASQLVQDARFPTGTVKFWYEAIFNDKPLVPPAEGDPNYDGKIAAFIAQQTMFDQLATVFVRDNGNGPYNLKDLLVEMFVSAWFRAAGIDDATGQETQLGSVGMGALLTPEQLERKIRSTLGVDWMLADEYQRLRPALTYIYNATYGGIDSDTINTRTRQINPLMLAVIRRMVSEMSCEVVYREFIDDTTIPPHDNPPMALRPASERILFADYDGETPADEAAIRQVLAHLHRQLWNDGATPDSPEVGYSFALFQDFWEYETTSNTENMRCTSNRYEDVVPLDTSRNLAYPPAALRVWRDMLAYFMSDPLFLNE